MKYFFSIVVGYCFGWTLFYLIFMGVDFRFFLKYLVLAWTSPGEIPVFINIGALSVSIIFTAGVWWFFRRKSTNKP
jgi:hypothetical protein